MPQLKTLKNFFLPMQDLVFILSDVKKKIIWPQHQISKLIIKQRQEKNIQVNAPHLKGTFLMHFLRI